MQWVKDTVWCFPIFFMGFELCIKSCHANLSPPSAHFNPPHRGRHFSATLHTPYRLANVPYIGCEPTGGRPRISMNQSALANQSTMSTAAFQQLRNLRFLMYCACHRVSVAPSKYPFTSRLAQPSNGNSMAVTRYTIGFGRCHCPACSEKGNPVSSIIRAPSRLWK